MARSASTAFGSGPIQRAGARARVPPYSEEAERGALGAALLDPMRVVDICQSSGILPESFYLTSHQQIYETLVEMLHQNQAIDLLTATQALRDRSMLEEVGGTTYLEQLVDATPTSAHAEYYIDIVYQKFLLRTMIDRARVTIEDCFAAEENAGEILGKVESAFFDIADQQRVATQNWVELVKNAMGEIETIFQTRKDLTGLPTGYIDLDDTLRGLQAGDMVVLAARPSMGKTSLAMNIAEHIATGYMGCSTQYADKEHHAVGIFSLEMSAEQLVKRMICCRAQVSSQKLTGNYMSTEQHRSLIAAADELTKAQIVLDDTPGLNVLELRSRARRMKRKYGVSLLIIDYLQLLHYPQRAENRQIEIGEVSGAVKAMAKELRIPVMVLSQLSRAPETRDRLAVPKLSDLRDSGSIEQDADVVILLRRPSRYPDDPEHDDKTLAIVEVAKHRNGPTGEIRLNFHEDHTRFADRVDTEPERDPDDAMVAGEGFR